jgi:predicted GIY-YIG superfamily endonuclease
VDIKSTKRELNHFYILRSDKTRRHYIGSTDNLERRVMDHNSGNTCSTKNRRPFFIRFQNIFKAYLKTNPDEIEYIGIEM